MSKRGAGTELNKDNYEREIEREGSEEAGTWQKADEVWLTRRPRLLRARAERPDSPGRPRWRSARSAKPSALRSDRKALRTRPLQRPRPTLSPTCNWSLRPQAQHLLLAASRLARLHPPRRLPLAVSRSARPHPPRHLPLAVSPSAQPHPPRRLLLAASRSAARRLQTSLRKPSPHQRVASPLGEERPPRPPRPASARAASSAVARA